jgi:N-acyl homoserine lactone hydrolase
VSRTDVDYSVSIPKSVLLLLGACLAASLSPAAVKHAKAPKTLRLYIFDCGTIHTTTVDAYSLKKEEVGSTEMAIPCILVAHPKGNLMWDNGDIPDRAFPSGGGRPPRV